MYPEAQPSAPELAATNPSLRPLETSIQSVDELNRIALRLSWEWYEYQSNDRLRIRDRDGIYYSIDYEAWADARSAIRSTAHRYWRR
jgi:hypothetical protein